MLQTSEVCGTCTLHTSKSITSFCKCHQVCMCFDCLQEAHKECFINNEVESIENATKNAHITLKENRRLFETLDSRVCEKRKRMDESLRKLDATENELTVGIRKMAQGVIEQVNRLATDALEVVSSVLCEHRLLLQHESESLAEFNNCMDDVRQHIRNSYFNDLENNEIEKFIANVSWFEKELENLEKEYRDSKFKLMNIKAHFFVSPVLMHIKENFKAFGELCVEDVSARMRSNYRIPSAIQRISVLPVSMDDSDTYRQDFHETLDDSLFIYDGDTGDFAQDHYICIDQQTFHDAPVPCMPPPLPPQRSPEIHRNARRFYDVGTESLQKGENNYARTNESLAHQTIETNSSEAMLTTTTNTPPATKTIRKHQTGNTIEHTDFHKHDMIKTDTSETQHKNVKTQSKATKFNVTSNLCDKMPSLPKKRNKSFNVSNPYTGDKQHNEATNTGDQRHEKLPFTCSQQQNKPTSCTDDTDMTSVTLRVKPKPPKPKPKPRSIERSKTVSVQNREPLEDTESSHTLQQNQPSVTLSTVQIRPASKVQGQTTTHLYTHFDPNKLSPMPHRKGMHKIQDSTSGSSSSFGSTHDSGIIIVNQELFPDHSDIPHMPSQKEKRSISPYHAQTLLNYQARHSDNEFGRKMSIGGCTELTLAKTASHNDVRCAQMGDVTNIRVAYGSNNSVVIRKTSELCDNRQFTDTDNIPPKGNENDVDTRINGSSEIDKSKSNSLLDAEMNMSFPDGKYAPLITGMAITADSRHMVICDYRNSRLLLFNTDLCLLQSYAISSPYGCCLIRESLFAITSTNRQSICIFDAGDSKMKCQREEKVGVDVFGISYTCGFFCVSCLNHVMVYTENLEPYRTVKPFANPAKAKGTFSKKCKSLKPYLVNVQYAAINWSVDDFYIYVSDFEKGRIVCLDINGSIKWNHLVTDPRGLVIHAEELFVAAKKKIFVLCARSGRNLREIQTGVSGCLWVLAIDSDKGCLYTSNGSSRAELARRINCVPI